MTFNPPNLSGVSRIVFDVEATGVDWKRDHAVGYVVAADDKAWYFPVAHEGGGNLPKDQVVSWLTKLLANPSLEVVGHFIKYDMHMAMNDGIRIAGPVECTGTNAALIDENQNNYNLEAVSNLYPDIPHKVVDIYPYLAEKFGGEPTRKDQIGNFYKLAGDDPKAIEYATGDGLSNLAVWDKQQVQLDNDKLRPVWAVERKVTRVLWKMERRGVRIDEAKLAWLEKRLEQMLFEAMKELPKDFNVRSAPQIAEYLKSQGYNGWPKTAIGNDSFTEAWLSTIEPGQRIIRVRKLTNLVNSFIGPLRKEHVFNGRVHTTFNQLRQDDYGTVTGRLSSSNPNMQQVPKRDKELAPLFRQVFLPEQGHRWSANDYSQQEFRAFTDYTGAKLLMDGYRSNPPIDIHTAVAQLLGVERDPTAKRMNLGMVYGMGIKKLARSLGIPETEAKFYMDKYHLLIPEARGFLKQAEGLARARGWVRTKLHRRRRFPDVRFCHKAGNAVIQGSCADSTKLKMVEVDEWFEQADAESALMLQVHDELDWTTPISEKRFNLEAKRIMESFGPKDKITFSVPMVVEQSLATNWGRASFPDWKG